LGMMHADQIKVRQALFNLLSNAVKFTHEGNISLEAIRKNVGGRDYILFRVTDTGIGLNAEQIVKLFQDFTQADASTTRKFGGTGLGLALTRRFCQMMGGDVTVQSVSGAGSVFTINLPANVGEPMIEQTADEVDAEVTTPLPQEWGEGHAQQLPPVGSCVLVIDDDPTQRELIGRFLSKEGFSVRTAARGETGLRLARQLRPVAITLDVMMPGMDGWEVLAALKADRELRNIPVIMLTMVDDPDRGFALGAAEFATKPVDRARLSEILKKYTCPHPPCPVLLVEDDFATRELTRAILQKEGWKVIEAENGRVGLERMEQVRPRLILLDLMMPEMDGFEFVSRVREKPEWRSIPIVVLTACDLNTEDRRRLNGYVELIIQKSLDTRDALLRQLREFLDGFPAPRVIPPAAKVKRAVLS
jgi:CheY-like chemotaxis protein/anti-sigma regulatory factor (Ser/Thr protein kinase)